MNETFSIHDSGIRHMREEAARCVAPGREENT